MARAAGATGQRSKRMIPLNSCHEGERVKILKVTGSAAIKRRLLDLGFLKGTELKVIRYAPLRDPMEVLIRKSHISLRMSEAALIQIEKTAS